MGQAFCRLQNECLCTALLPFCSGIRNNNNSLHVGHFVLPAQAPHKRLELPARARKRSNVTRDHLWAITTTRPNVAHRWPLVTSCCGNAHAPGALNVPQPGVVLVPGAQNDPHVRKAKWNKTTFYNCYTLAAAVLCLCPSSASFSFNFTSWHDPVQTNREHSHRCLTYMWVMLSPRRQHHTWLGNV